MGVMGIVVRIGILIAVISTGIDWHVAVVVFAADIVLETAVNAVNYARLYFRPSSFVDRREHLLFVQQAIDEMTEDHKAVRLHPGTLERLLVEDYPEAGGIREIRFALGELEEEGSLAFTNQRTLVRMTRQGRAAARKGRLPFDPPPPRPRRLPDIRNSPGAVVFGDNANGNNIVGNGSSAESIRISQAQHQLLSQLQFVPQFIIRLPRAQARAEAARLLNDASEAVRRKDRTTAQRAIWRLEALLVGIAPNALWDAIKELLNRLRT